jgi:hypothetical protein
MRGSMETADAESVFAAQLFMIRMQQGRLHELVDAAEHFMEEYPALDPWRAALPLAYLAGGATTRRASGSSGWSRSSTRCRATSSG